MDKKNPEFSVVITAHNKGKFIRQTIESVLNQTFQDFELIVFDHGSTDNTSGIVASIPDARIRYVYKEDCGLPACARNKGMALSAGKYIALLDGDDFWYKNKLERCKNVFDNMPEVDLVCHNLAVMHNDKVLRYTSFSPYVKEMYKKLLFEGNCLSPSAVAIRRNVFFDDGLRFSEDRAIFVAEDYEYWLRLSRRYRFYFISEVLGYYRVSESGVYLENIEAATVNMLNLLDSHFAGFDCTNIDMRGMMKKRKSSVMCAAGRMYSHKGQFKESRRWYVRALSEYPFDYKACVGFLSSLLRIRILYR